MSEIEPSVGIHASEEATTYQRAVSGRFLSRWLHRLEDTEDRGNNAWRATRHLYRRSALLASRMIPGEWDHLDDMELTSAAVDADDATKDDWYRRSLDQPPLTPIQATARSAGISRSTEWRRRTRDVKHRN